MLRSCKKNDRTVVETLKSHQVHFMRQREKESIRFWWQRTEEKSFDIRFRELWEEVRKFVPLAAVAAALGNKRWLLWNQYLFFLFFSSFACTSVPPFLISSSNILPPFLLQKRVTPAASVPPPSLRGTSEYNYVHTKEEEEEEEVFFPSIALPAITPPFSFPSFSAKRCARGTSFLPPSAHWNRLTR